jgi:hypothetical protein
VADLADVEKALLLIIQAAVYPNGVASASIVNATVTIYRGWPISAQLDADLAAGKCHISVFSPPGMERNTTRYPRSEEVVTKPTHTLAATVNGNQITIGGAVSTPQNIVILCGNQAFPYQVQSNDTLASIAAALAVLIAVAFPTTSASGPVITIAGNPSVVHGRIGGQFTTWTEQKRQERQVQITLWCPTPALRDPLAGALDLALCENDFITTSDQSAVRLRYARTLVSDEGQKVQIFRRDLFYTVEYPTALTQAVAETVTLGVSDQINGGAASAPLYV